MERRFERVRSSALFGANPGNRATLRDRQRCEQPGDEATQIRKATEWRTQHDDGDGEARQVLLKRKVVVDGDEGVELVLRSLQEVAILQRSPASLRHRLHVVSPDVGREASIAHSS